MKGGAALPLHGDNGQTRTAMRGDSPRGVAADGDAVLFPTDDRSMTKWQAEKAWFVTCCQCSVMGMAHACHERR